MFAKSIIYGIICHRHGICVTLTIRSFEEVNALSSRGRRRHDYIVIVVVAMLVGAVVFFGVDSYETYRTLRSYDSSDIKSTTAPIATATPQAPVAAPKIETPSEVATTPQAIEPSIPVSIRVPSVGLDVQILPESCPVDDGMVHPPIDEAEKPCYYTAADKPYQLPGSDTADLTAIFGHTGHCDADCAAFNRLYDWQQQQWLVQPGDELYLRTEASGDSWLVYRAADFYTPDKYGDGAGSLANSSEIWGSQPRPNYLLTIGCLQDADGSSRSSQNIVIGWTFDRIEKGAN